MDFWGLLFKKKDPPASASVKVPAEKSRDGESVLPHERSAIKGGTCPDCGSKEWLEGSSGCGSTNWMCANRACGSKFNIGYFSGLYLVERISPPSPLAKGA